MKRLLNIRNLFLFWVFQARMVAAENEYCPPPIHDNSPKTDTLNQIFQAPSRGSSTSGVETRGPQASPLQFENDVNNFLAKNPNAKFDKASFEKLLNEIPESPPEVSMERAIQIYADAYIRQSQDEAIKILNETPEISWSAFEEKTVERNLPEEHLKQIYFNFQMARNVGLERQTEYQRAFFVAENSKPGEGFGPEYERSMSELDKSLSTSRAQIDQLTQQFPELATASDEIQTLVAPNLRAERQETLEHMATLVLNLYDTSYQIGFNSALIQKNGASKKLDEVLDRATNRRKEILKALEIISAQNPGLIPVDNFRAEQEEMRKKGVRAITQARPSSNEKATRTWRDAVGNLGEQSIHGLGEFGNLLLAGGAYYAGLAANVLPGENNFQQAWSGGVLNYYRDYLYETGRESILGSDGKIAKSSLASLTLKGLTAPTAGIGAIDGVIDHARMKAAGFSDDELELWNYAKENVTSVQVGGGLVGAGATVLSVVATGGLGTGSRAAQLGKLATGTARIGGLSATGALSQQLVAMGEQGANFNAGQFTSDTFSGLTTSALIMGAFGGLQKTLPKISQAVSRGKIAQRASGLSGPVAERYTRFAEYKSGISGTKLAYSIGAANEGADVLDSVGQNYEQIKDVHTPLGALGAAVSIIAGAWDAAGDGGHKKTKTNTNSHEGPSSSHSHHQTSAALTSLAAPITSQINTLPQIEIRSLARDWFTKGTSVEVPIQSQHPVSLENQWKQTETHLNSNGVTLNMSVARLLPNGGTQIQTPASYLDSVIERYRAHQERVESSRRLPGIDLKFDEAQSLADFYRESGIERPASQDLDSLRNGAGEIYRHVQDARARLQTHEVITTVRRQQFPPYQKADETLFKNLPEELAPEYQSSIRGIQEFFNSSDRVIARLDELKAKVDERSRKKSISREEALEEIRREFEAKNGFEEPIRVTKILDTNEWHDLLQSGRPVIDYDSTHSLSQSDSSLDGQNVHRNQWLLVMMEMDANRVAFGGGTVSASDIFKKLGEKKWIDEWFNSLDEDTRQFRANSRSPWYFLFDYGLDPIKFTGEFSNISNFLYANEVFNRHLNVSEPPSISSQQSQVIDEAIRSHYAGEDLNLIHRLDVENRLIEVMQVRPSTSLEQAKAVIKEIENFRDRDDRSPRLIADAVGRLRDAGFGAMEAKQIVSGRGFQNTPELTFEIRKQREVFRNILAATGSDKQRYSLPNTARQSEPITANHPLFQPNQEEPQMRAAEALIDETVDRLQISDPHLQGSAVRSMAKWINSFNPIASGRCEGCSRDDFLAGRLDHLLDEAFLVDSKTKSLKDSEFKVGVERLAWSTGQKPTDILKKILMNEKVELPIDSDLDVREFLQDVDRARDISNFANRVGARGISSAHALTNRQGSPLLFSGERNSIIAALGNDTSEIRYWVEIPAKDNPALAARAMIQSAEVKADGALEVQTHLPENLRIEEELSSALSKEIMEIFGAYQKINPDAQLQIAGSNVDSLHGLLESLPNSVRPRLRVFAPPRSRPNSIENRRYARSPDLSELNWSETEFGSSQEFLTSIASSVGLRPEFVKPDALEGARLITLRNSNADTSGSESVLVSAAASPDFVYVPLEGSFKIERDGGGQLPYEIRSGVLGDFGAATNSPRSATVVLGIDTDQARVIAIPRETYLRHWLPYTYDLNNISPALKARFPDEVSGFGPFPNDALGDSQGDTRWIANAFLKARQQTKELKAISADEIRVDHQQTVADYGKFLAEAEYEKFSDANSARVQFSSSVGGQTPLRGKPRKFRRAELANGDFISVAETIGADGQVEDLEAIVIKKVTRPNGDVDHELKFLKQNATTKEFEETRSCQGCHAMSRSPNGESRLVTFAGSPPENAQIGHVRIANLDSNGDGTTLQAGSPFTIARLPVARSSNASNPSHERIQRALQSYGVNNSETVSRILSRYDSGGVITGANVRLNPTGGENLKRIESILRGESNGGLTPQQEWLMGQDSGGPTLILIDEAFQDGGPISLGDKGLKIVGIPPAIVNDGTLTLGATELGLFETLRHELTHQRLPSVGLTRTNSKEGSAFTLLDELAANIVGMGNLEKAWSETQRNYPRYLMSAGLRQGLSPREAVTQLVKILESSPTTKRYVPELKRVYGNIIPGLDPAGIGNKPMVARSESQSEAVISIESRDSKGSL